MLTLPAISDILTFEVIKMAIVQIQDNKIELPKEILSQLHLANGKTVELEVIADSQLRVKPVPGMGTKERLKKVLNKGFHMGEVYALDREAIYDEID